MDGDVKVLVEALENAFDFKFVPGELTDESSLDEVYAVIRTHISNLHSDRCFTSIVYWRLRRGCGELFGVPRQSIAPWTATDLILPSAQRRRCWFDLSAAARVRLPGLEYSSGVGHTIWWGSLVPPTALAIVGHGGWWIPAAIVLWIVTANLLFKFLKPLADVLPKNSSTFGDLAKTVVALNYGTLVCEFGSSREAEMLESVRYVIADLIDIDPHALIDENPRLIDLAIANDGFRAQV
jgi:hypothetical protein